MVNAEALVKTHCKGLHSTATARLRLNCACYTLILSSRVLEGAVCATKSADCPNPYFAHNIYKLLHACGFSGEMLGSDVGEKMSRSICEASLSDDAHCKMRRYCCYAWQLSLVRRVIFVYIFPSFVWPLTVSIFPNAHMLKGSVACPAPPRQWFVNVTSHLAICIITCLTD